MTLLTWVIPACIEAHAGPSAVDRVGRIRCACGEQFDGWHIHRAHVAEKVTEAVAAFHRDPEAPPRAEDPNGRLEICLGGLTDAAISTAEFLLASPMEGVQTIGRGLDEAIRRWGAAPAGPVLLTHRSCQGVSEQ